MTNGDALHRRVSNRITGFTLIELVVVISVISLLLTIAMPRYFASLDRGKVVVQQQNIVALRDAIDKFYGDNTRYPETLEELVAKRYLRAVPIDPVTELANWVLVPPIDPNQTGVFDVKSAQNDAEAGYGKSKP
jgi:general secretion pathway protein G